MDTIRLTDPDAGVQGTVALPDSWHVAGEDDGRVVFMPPRDDLPRSTGAARFATNIVALVTSEDREDAPTSDAVIAESRTTAPDGSTRHTTLSVSRERGTDLVQYSVTHTNADDHSLVVVLSATHDEWSRWKPSVIEAIDASHLTAGAPR